MRPDQDPGKSRTALTTTHAGWGAGHPRIVATNGAERYVHELDCDLTHIGSSDDSDFNLPDTDALHAKILHDMNDEYVLTMVGAGETSFGRHEVLRTGAHFMAGPWQLVFARDEFAEHGRPYGGRRGGELAHQKPQRSRPDYATEHPASSLTRCSVKEPGQSATPDQTRALGQAALRDTRADGPRRAALDFEVVNDEAAGVYEAVADGATVGGMTYNFLAGDRVLLLAVSVFPQFRGRGVATELTRRVLDDVRAQGKTVVNYCPVVEEFVQHNSAYADLIDRSVLGGSASRGPRP